MAKESTIRVFRSDTTSVPTGLTFGELAFSHVAGNSQLYIGNTAGAPVWIGAGVTTGNVDNGSEFLVPTQSAVKAFVEAEVGEIVGGGGGVVNNFNGTGGSVTMTGDGGAIFNVQTDKDNVIGARLASTSVTGVASFSSTNFAVAAGQVTIKDGGVANAELVSPFIVVRNDTGTTGDVQLGNTLTITGNQGLDIALGKSTGAVTITLANTGVLSINGSTGNYGLPLASTSVTGVASFNDSYFSVDGNGKVALVAAYQVTGDTVSAGSFIGVTRSGNSVTVNNTGVHSINGLTGAYVVPVASTSVTGFASFSDANFAVSAGQVTIKDGGVANAELVNSSINFTDGSSSSAVALGGTLTITGSANEILVSQSSGTYTIGLPDNVVIDGNLTVNGTVVTTNVTNMVIEDPLLMLGTGNAADTVDLGFYGKYASGGTKFAGLYRDANDGGKFKLFVDLADEPTTTVGSGGLTGTLVAIIDGGTY